MSFKLEEEEDFSIGIQRLTNEEVTSAYDSLESMTTNKRHHAIHGIRKSFKKSRAIIRLVRDKIGPQRYKEENVFYRDLGRMVSDLRDSSSVIEVTEQLKLQYDKELGAQAFHDPIESLKFYRKELVHQHLTQESRLDHIKTALNEKLKQDTSWLHPLSSFEEIAPSIKRVYTRGKEAYAKSQESKKSEDLHEWRKRVNYLRYQMSVLSRIWPHVLVAFKKELHDMSDFLGTDHDLSILEEKINNEHIKFKDSTEKVLLLALIEHQRDQLQTHAFIKGENLYQIHSDGFIEILGTCWGTYQRKIDTNNLSQLDSLKY